MAEITPLCKDGDLSFAANYHPISILPAVSKLLECVVHTQVYHYIEDHSILSKAQFRFRKGHSTSSCILNSVDESNKFIGVVFLFLKKAFDTVDHQILLKRLYPGPLIIYSIYQ